MQTSRALTDIVIKIWDTMIYGAAIFLGTLALIEAVDRRLLTGFGLLSASFRLFLVSLGGLLLLFSTLGSLRF